MKKFTPETLEIDQKKFDKLTKDVFDNIEDKEKTAKLITDAIDNAILDELRQKLKEE